MILEDLTREFGLWLPGAFIRTVGAEKPGLVECFNERSRLFQYKESDIHFEGGFEVDGERKKIIILGSSYDKKGRIYLEGSMKHSEEEVKNSSYLSNRRVELRQAGRIFRISCDLRKVPETDDEKEEVFEESYNLLVRESIRICCKRNPTRQ